jgi:hypothetical protein
MHKPAFVPKSLQDAASRCRVKRPRGVSLGVRIAGAATPVPTDSGTVAAKTTAVFFRHSDLERPVLVVVERTLRSGPDVQIAIRSEADEHLSLHREESGLILLTHRSPNKPPSVWDETRVSLARRAGLRHPERHGEYYQHHPLARFEGVEGHHLVGKLVEIENAPARAKYARGPRITVEATARRFTLNINLTTPGQQLRSEVPCVPTAFGALYFRMTEPRGWALHTRSMSSAIVRTLRTTGAH